MADINVIIDGGSGLVTGVYNRPQAGSVVIDDSDARYIAFLATLVPAVQLDAIHLQLLFLKRNANMQSTSDQQFTKMFRGTLYKPTMIVGKRVSGGTTIVCAGGIYTAAAKGGDAIVAAAQSWINMTAAKKIVNASLAALVDTDIHDETPYLSLTTGSTAACLADLFIFGIVLD